MKSIFPAKAAAALAIAPFLFAQSLTSPAERQRGFERYLVRRGSEVTRESLADVRTAADWSRRRPELHRQLLYSLGLDPMPVRGPLHARTTARLERTGYTVENVVFQSLPGLYVTGNLYLPTGPPASKPAVLYVCGHSPVPSGAKAAYQRNGIWLARLGYVVLILDPIHFGEVPGIHHGLHSLGMWHWLSLGYTPVGPEVWSAMRALDYLETRPEVDRSRFAVTGGSGGGAVSWYLAAVDERIRAAVPRCATWTVENQAAANGIFENCDCIYFPNVYQLDLPVVGALIAPRPLKILNAMRDPMFPQAGYLDVYRRASRIYGLSGNGERIEEFEEDVPHRDTPAFRGNAYGWIDRWLKRSGAPFIEQELEPEPAHNLAVLAEPPADARNHSIHRTFIPTHRLQPCNTLEQWQQRRRALVAELRDKVFRGFPRTKVPFSLSRRKDGGWPSRFGDTQDLEFATEEGVRISAKLYRPHGDSASLPVLIQVRGSEDIIYAADHDFLLPAIGRHVILRLDPRATDYPVNNMQMAILKRTAALVGGTIESMQIWDILRSVDLLIEQEKLRPASISVYGRGQMGVLGIYAAALDERITRVIIDDPPASHWQGPALLNVLRVTDIPEAAGLVAPRELVSLTPLAGPYGYTASIYALHRRQAAFREVDGLPQALRIGGKLP